jgi:hypothetical protein
LSQLELGPEEVEVLRQVFDTYLSDLRMEIAATDRMDFREELKRQEAILRQLEERLPAQGA